MKTGILRPTVGLVPTCRQVTSCKCLLINLLHHCLKPIRFMHPGTPHIVVMTGTCVTYGAHFYNMDVLHCTFAAMVADHFVGEHVVNTEHTRAPLLLFKGLDAILEDLFVTYGDGEWPLPERGLLSSLVFKALLTDHYCRTVHIAGSRMAHPSCPLYASAITPRAKKCTGSRQRLATLSRIWRGLHVCQG